MKFAHNTAVYKGKKPWLLLTFSSQKLLVSVETLLCARPSTCIMSFNSQSSHVRLTLILSYFIYKAQTCDNFSKVKYLVGGGIGI